MSPRDDLRRLVDAFRDRRPERAGSPEEAVAELVDSLRSAASLASLARDPYWPKWDTPWWKLLLLLELGRADAAPRAAVDALADAVERTYLTSFPLTEAELPEGVDPYRNIVCHCALGSVYRMLHAMGIPVDERFPWMRRWFATYQLPDGGLNCDEQVYGRTEPHSSFLSTLPPLEAVLGTRRPDELNEVDREFLERGVAYLLRRKLCRSVSKGGRVIDERWLAPSFPRFYDYDVLRGLALVTAWAAAVERPLPSSAMVEAVQAVGRTLDDGGAVRNRGREFVAEGSLRHDGDGPWTFRREASAFAVLDGLNRDGEPSSPLTDQWYEVLERLVRLDEAGLLVD